jgi:hypothetical protein
MTLREDKIILDCTMDTETARRLDVKDKQYFSHMRIVTTAKLHQYHFNSVTEIRHDN